MKKGTRALRAATALTTLVLTGVVGCGSTAQRPDRSPPEDIPEFGASASELGVEVNSCSQAGSSGWDDSTMTLTLDTTQATTIVLAIDGTAIKANGYACVDSNGDELSKAVVRKIVVNGADGVNEKLILDLLPGTFGYPVFSSLGGITVDLGTGTDSFMVRGTTGADNFTFGESAGDVFAELSGDAYADVMVSNTETFVVSLSEGADRFTANGGAKSAAHLATGVTSLDAMTTGITLYGGDGNDTLRGGDGADSIYGGPDTDTFQTDADGADGADQYFGGAGTDTMDYSDRTDAVVAILGPTGPTKVRTGSGNVSANPTAGDVVFIIDGGDEITATMAGTEANCAAVESVIDTAAGVEVASCSTEVLVLTGATSIQITGGTAGTLTDLGLTSDAVDGKAGETDFLDYGVENIKGGTGDDTLTGSDVSNTIEGGEGADTIWGGLANASCESDVDTLKGDDGDDVFEMSDTSDCSDTIYGGAGTDTADYHERTNALTITINSVANDGEASEEDNIRTDVENIYGGLGADEITGSTSANVLHGGPGVDTLYGGSGDDTLIGGTGDDELNGDAGDDTFDEGDTVDSLYTAVEKGYGNDVINGGAGFDMVTYADRDAAVTITVCVSTTLQGAGTAVDGTQACTADDGETGQDTTNNIINVEHIKGATAAVVNTITGTTADETIEGGAGDDVLKGGDGNDTIFGNGGVDSLSGEAGDDYLDSGAGDDTLVSGGDGDGDICVNGGGTDVSTTGCEL